MRAFTIALALPCLILACEDDDDDGVLADGGTAAVLVREVCETTSFSSSQTSCEVREECMSGYRYTFCTEQSEGDWSCQCSDSFTARDLQVSAASAPCRDVNGVCSTLATPQATGEETCEVDTQTATSTYCEMQLNCAIATPITNDISAVLSDYRYASCSDDGDQGLSCSCSGNITTRSFTLTGTTPQEGCEPAAALCGGVPLRTVGEEDCTVEYEYSASNSCQRQENCERTVASGDAEAALSETKTANCSTDSDDVTTCSCSNSTRSYAFALGGDVDPIDACPSAIDVCDSTDTPEPSGPIECELATQMATSDYCSATTQCTQVAVIEGVEIELHGTVSSYCQPNGDAWYCQCTSGTASSSVTVEADEAWDACEEVAEQCPDLVGIQIATN